jgi:MFS family permease
LKGYYDRKSQFKKEISWKRTFTALKYPNYRLWFWGQMISLFGTWMQTTAQGFLVFQLTNSPIFLGYVGFAAGIPALIFTLYGGVIADRFPRRSVLIVTQFVMMALALVQAFLTFTGLIMPWHLIVMAFLLGITNAFDSPARQAFVLEMVDRKDLLNAIALNATMFNSASALGPAIAGVTYALFGPGWCFMINGISFLGVIAALRMMKLPKFVKPEATKSVLAELKEGIIYVTKKEKLILVLTVTVSVTGMFGISFATLFPAWAVKILHGDAATNGLIQSARGVGAFFGALTVASLSHLKIKGKMFTIGTFMFPLLILIFSFVRFLPLTMIILFFVGAFSLMILNVANGLVQTLVSDSLRGRVMAIYSITFFGFMPLGSLFIGFIAEHFGEPMAVAVNSLFLILFALSLWIFVPKLRAQK